MATGFGFDKVLHFMFSYIIALADPILAYAAGIGKEIFDLVRGTFIDPADLLADLLGILTAGWLS